MALPTLAIVGGGPAGLTSLRHALAAGFNAVAFEAHGRVGGVWRGDETSLAWKGLPTYFSKHTCAFPDLAHPTDAPLFLSREEMQRYLQTYVDTYKLRDHILLNTRVTEVKLLRPIDGDTQTAEPPKWIVTWTAADGVVQSRTFDFVIFASGVFAKAYMPSASAKAAVEEHSGMVSHTSSFNLEVMAALAASRRHAAPSSCHDADDTAHPYEGLRVLVVGSSFSGCDIAVTLAEGGAEVEASFRKSSYLVPRYVNGRPMDEVFYRRTRESHARATGRWKPASADEGPRLFVAEHERARSVCAPWWKAVPSLAVDNPPLTEPPFITVSDRFLPAVAEGRITIVPSGVETVHVVPRDATTESSDLGCSSVVTHQVVVGLRNGKLDTYDHVILATGYTTDMSYVEPAVLECAGYKSTDLLQPFLLYKATVHPDLPTCAFVGLYRGPFFSVMDLQAMWAISLFSRRTTLPPRDVVMASLDHERVRRHMEPRPQFPHGEYSYFLDELSVEAGCDVMDAFSNPVVVEAAGGEEALAQLIFDAPTLPQHFRLASRDNAVALKALQEIQLHVATR